jgi:hypothetical protein
MTSKLSKMNTQKSQSDDAILHIIKAIVYACLDTYKSRNNEIATQTAYSSSSIAESTKSFFKDVLPKGMSYFVTDILAAFMIRAIVLNPTNHFHIDKELAAADVDRLIKVRGKH